MPDLPASIVPILLPFAPPFTTLNWRHCVNATPDQEPVLISALLMEALLNQLAETS